jgi:predicted permease
MRWWRRLHARLKYRHFDRDLREELSTHRAMTEEDARRSGVPPAAIESNASRALGNTTLAREESRAVWVPQMIEGLLRDARYGARALRRQPSFTVTAVATLAVAVGLNASLVNLISTGFLRPWSVPDVGRVVAVSLVPRPGAPASSVGATLPLAEFESMQGRAKTVDLVAFEMSGLRVRPGAGDTFEFAQVLYVSENFFTTLAGPLEKGRGFAADRSGAGTPDVVISDRLWRALFAGDEAIVGRVVRLNDVPATIVGVAAKEFAGLGGFKADAFISIRSMPAWDYGWMSEYLKAPQTGPVTVAARLRLGQTRAHAQAELSVLHHDLGGDAGPRARDLRVSGTAAFDQPNGMPPALMMILGLLFAAGLLVLLLACANLVNLQLARSLGRQREIAVRLALGANRARVVRQLMVECGLLAALAYGPAVGIAWVLPPAVLSFDSASTSVSFAPDWLTMTCTFVACLAAVVTFGLAPTLDVTRRSRIAAGPTASGSPQTGGWRNAILGVQIATSLVLLVGATLLTRGVMRATSEDTLGFRVRGVDVMGLGSTEVARKSIASRLAAAILASGLEVAFADTMPLRTHLLDEVSVDGRAGATRACVVGVSSSYFDVLDIPIVAGRRHSDDPARHEVVVNRTLARLLWPERSPLGQSLVAIDGRTRETLTVVGVSADARTSSLEHVDPAMYRALGDPDAFMFFPNAAPDLPARIAAMASSIDARAKVSGGPFGRSLQRAVRNSLVSAGVASGIGVVALFLATVGVFGVFAFMVEERRREIGIRMALGARRSQVIRLILGGMRWAIGGGLVVGALMAVGIGFVLRRYLLGLSPLDVGTYLTVAVILTSAGIIASYVPARRAARVDPALTLKAD